MREFFCHRARCKKPAAHGVSRPFDVGSYIASEAEGYWFEPSRVYYSIASAIAVVSWSGLGFASSNSLYLPLFAGGPLRSAEPDAASKRPLVRPAGGLAINAPNRQEAIVSPSRRGFGHNEVRLVTIEPAVRARHIRHDRSLPHDRWLPQSRECRSVRRSESFRPLTLTHGRRDMKSCQAPGTRPTSRRFGSRSA